MTRKLDIDTVIFNPRRFFRTPEDIVHDKELLVHKEQKIQALRNWKLDIEQQRVAEEENMQPLLNEREVTLEGRINLALTELQDSPIPTSTKFGSI